MGYMQLMQQYLEKFYCGMVAKPMGLIIVNGSRQYFFK